MFWGENSYVFVVELGTVLFRLFTEHSDIDIRDRAKFYYALLTCHSPAKVKYLQLSSVFFNRDW